MVAYSVHTKEQLKELDKENVYLTKTAKLVANRKYIASKNLKSVQIPMELYELLKSKNYGETLVESARNIAKLLKKGK